MRGAVQEGFQPFTGSTWERGGGGMRRAVQEGFQPFTGSTWGKGGRGCVIFDVRERPCRPGMADQIFKWCCQSRSGSTKSILVR